MGKNLYQHESLISISERASLFQQGATLWFTGLSGAGKSTIAFALEKQLLEQGVACAVLDGDSVREGLNRDLGFSHEDRSENIRRMGEVAKLFSQSGMITCICLISPYQQDRDKVRDLHVQSNQPFYEVFIDTSLALCEQRDVKGLYKKARAGVIPQFTGVSDVYEPPEDAEIVINGDKISIEDAVDTVLQQLMKDNILEIEYASFATRK